jgi:hypothetical protein
MLKISSYFGVKTDGVSGCFVWGRGGGRGSGNFPTFLLKIGSGAAAHWILDHGSGIWV